MQTTHGVVIAGAGLAAQRCCAALRAGGYDGAIRVVGAERHAPYDRPPLSKAFLAGEHAAPALALRPAGWYAQQAVQLLRSRPPPGGGGGARAGGGTAAARPPRRAAVAGRAGARARWRRAPALRPPGR